MSTIDRVPNVSALVISHNHKEIIRACLASLSFVVELIMVDKSSTFQSQSCFTRLPMKFATSFG